MSIIKTVRLKPEKEVSLKNRHRWVFSGAIADASGAEDGEEVRVADAKGVFYGRGTYHSKTSISVRIHAFSETSLEETVRERVAAAKKLREALFDPAVTNAYRLIHSEADGLPGVVVDRYADVLVVQISTLGAELRKNALVEALVETFSPRAILEKSNIPSRKEEGLAPFEGMLFGAASAEVEVLENGMKFFVRFDGQKTGFFLDQREERELVRTLSKGRKVLNAFAYSGGFSVAALSGGALKVDTLDISESAVELARRNVAANGFDTTENWFIADDAFNFLRARPLDYGLVVLDPPAFAKKKSDVENAVRGYREINATTMKKMPAGSFLLTCSCSYFVDEELFQKTLFHAARDAKRDVRILSKHRLAADHPISIFHPEGDYLKSFLLYLE
ncbi:MAG: rRNA (cytosine1962-C5)-methyltransferase [Patescibacteria group bacterium]|nr:rRNA (cytosine1962-C5)-methyltransferase [Patescibacteria group bacterium]